MCTAFASQAAHIHKAAGLSSADIARATGAEESTVRAWIRGTREPSGRRAERLTELAALVDRLLLVMRADYIVVWMRRPIALLDDDKPLDVIGRGDYRSVSRVIAGLESPGAA
jgi:transcriptional regulator with XRE-family HTH domain